MTGRLCLRVSDELGRFLVPLEAGEVLLGGDQHQPFAVGLLAERPRLGTRVTMMIRKAPRDGHRHTGIRKRCKKFFRIADPCEGKYPPATERCDELWIRPQVRPQDGKIVSARLLDNAAGAQWRANQQQGVRTGELRRERRPQRPPRDHTAITDAAALVDDKEGKVLMERRVLESIVHYDDACARRRPARSREAGAGHDRARDTRQKERLVADLSGMLMRRIDFDRSGEGAAVAPGQEHRPLARLLQDARHGQCGRGLAGAAYGRIAHADHRRRHAHAALPQPRPRHGAIDRRHRREHTRGGAGRAPPE